MPSRTRTSGPDRSRWRQRTSRYGAAYLLVSPAVLATVAFFYVPMALSLYWSFTRYNGITPPQWAGLENYRDVLGSHRFQQAFSNTVWFVLMTMTCGPLLGLATALLLNSRTRVMSVFRTAYFLPVTMSLVAVATVWRMLLNDDGLVNTALRAVGLPGHAWLTDPSTALVSISAVSVWQGFGFETVVFLAALQAVPADLHDAASVDGAGSWRRLWHVTLPALRPTMLFVFVYGIIGGFQAFDQMFVMTQGGPLGSTTTIVYYLVERFNNLDLGVASAVAYLLLLVLAMLSYVQLRAYRRPG